MHTSIGVAGIIGVFSLRKVTVTMIVCSICWTTAAPADSDSFVFSLNQLCSVTNLYCFLCIHGFVGRVSMFLLAFIRAGLWLL